MKYLFKTLPTLAVMASMCSPLALAANLKVHPLLQEDDQWGDYTSWSLRDREEFLWVASDNGLKRFDGYSFRIYAHDAGRPASIGSDAIRHLMLQSDGSLWANGPTLNKYHPETDSFTSYTVTDDRTVRDAYEDSAGMFWLVGEGFGLLHFNPQTGEVIRQFLHEQPGTAYISRILPRFDSDQVWLASAAGVVLFDTKTYESEHHPLPIDLNAGLTGIHDIAEDARGHLWITTGEGLFVLDASRGVLQHFVAQPETPGALGTNRLWAIKIDSRGQVWLGTDKQGVYRYDPATGQFRHFPSSSFDSYRFPPGTVTHINEDAKGNMWFAFGAYGIFRLSEHLEKFQAYRHSFDSENSLGFNNVLDLLEDQSGNIWIATDGGGLDKFDPAAETFTHYQHDPSDETSISADAVVALAEDSQGNIWVGTWNGGLNRFDPRTNRFERIARDPHAADGQTLAGDSVFQIHVDDEDRLLLSIWGRGLQVFDSRSHEFTTYFANRNDVSGPDNESITAIVPSPDGGYFLAGYHGLEKFFPETGTFTQLDFPIAADISGLHLDPEGFLWAATNKGLVRYNPVSQAREIFTTQNGLSDNFVMSVEADDSGFLWVGTSKGLSRLDPNTREIIAYDEHDGLAGRHFNRFSHLKSRDGTLYFGGTRGFTRFDPSELPINEHAPVVHITAVEVDQNSLQPGDLEELQTVVNYADHISLPHNHRDLAVHFTATNFVTPVKNRFRYKLKGLEEDWVEVDSRRRQAHYSNLEPGEYVFQVIAANNEGVWSGSAKELAITVLPAWWQTWWARSLYALAAAVGVYGFSQWRSRANRKRARRLQSLVAEQTAKLKNANRAISQLNSELEQRVEHRTRELYSEIEERKESEAKANYIAYHDGLTGLYNRPWLLQHLEKLLQRGTPLALLFIAGDRFRKINDTYGHLQGDKLLKASAERLVGALPEGGHAVRLGSDEFVAVIDHADPVQTAGLADSIIREFKAPFSIDGVRMNLGVSVGYVISDDGYSEPSQVVRNANIAMQRAKDRGRGVSQLFDQAILRETLDLAALEADLKLALSRNQFTVVYQPIIVLDTGELSGFEALIRWQHPERGFVPPDKFISMAESLGLISDIGLWVLEQACLQLQQWRDELGLQVLPSMAVNLSPVQLEHVDLPLRVDQIFMRTGVGRSDVKFEITESALMKHTDTVDGMLDALRERGIELAIDDFGTGYSSLSYLDKLPVQVLKIDRSFVNGLTDQDDNTSAHEIVRATASLAHNLKMRVVAEGIETSEQMALLKAARCDYGQGYYIARPLSAEDATAFLSRSRVRRLSQSPLGG